MTDKSVSHYLVEEMNDGRVKVSAGGTVSIARTYYQALENLAKSQQEHIDDLPDHLREEQKNSIYHDIVNPETENVIANDADWIREEVVEDVKNGADISQKGAWLARCSERDVELLGDEISVYKKWETIYNGRQ